MTMAQDNVFALSAAEAMLFIKWFLLVLYSKIGVDA
jgi:hypothetical protein